MARKGAEDPRLRALTRICLALPGATRTDGAGHATFRVRGKVFAYFLNDHHGDGIVSVCGRTEMGEHEELARREPQRFYLPAYIGARGWFGLRLDRGRIAWREVRRLLLRSYELAAPTSQRVRTKSRSARRPGLAAQPLAQVESYLAALPPARRKVAQQLRSIIRAAIPGAIEHFSYRIPGFRLDGRPLVWYAVWQQHASLYPITKDLQRAHAAALRRYKTSAGTVQLPLQEPIPAALVKRLVRARAAELRSAAP